MSSAMIVPEFKNFDNGAGLLLSTHTGPSCFRSRSRALVCMI